MEWYMSIVYSIITFLCCCVLRESENVKELILKILAVIALPTTLWVVFVNFFLCTNKSVLFFVLMEIGLCISLLFLLLMFEWKIASLATFWGIAWIVIIGMSMFFAATDSRFAPSTEKQHIAWDYNNPVITVAEYEIIGVREDSIIISVALGEENTLRKIPIEEIKVKYRDNVLIPYMYRENYKYIEYDYSKEPPQELRCDTSTWTEYVLCGTKQQIQALFGYQENLAFEQ